MVAEEIWNHFETERKVSIMSKNEIRARTRWVDGCGREVRSGRDGNVGGVIPGGISRRVGVGNIAAESGMSRFEIWAFGGGGRNIRGDITSRGVATDETAPSFVGLVDDLHGVLLVLSLAGEGELVLGLSIGDLVDPGMVKDWDGSPDGAHVVHT